MPTILTSSDREASQIARKLLEASKGDESRFRIVTTGRRLAFEVDDALADEIGADTTDEPDAAGDDSADETETVPDPPLVSGEPVIPVDDLEVPDRNGRTADWAEYMRTRFQIHTGGMTRAELIAEYDKRTGDA
ncbi:hypothetical protein KNU63_gp24 [Gordonia phage RogerDodger]|uniref:Uncharacterized protein n=2 Tax=Wizardvirus TaxID=2169658 RepID=A0A4Y5U0C8_9CAUD|nr:hypothetical protein KNU56_gp24 [Gordonia phage Arri]YP_010103034.1 hypothetical protein KNU63_gp24 [Gordonia phage RogerDodger]QDB74801.1 hypothetical protein SEA_ARRI_24 [Gordonia phage Arri]QDM56106.1 hypothetical protein SEA_ROGERDODGER_24 [Gordonia phage RogerDodger]